MAGYSSALAGAAGGRGSASNPFGLPGASHTGAGDFLAPPLPHGLLATNANGPTTQHGTNQNPGQTPVMPIPATQATTPGAAGAPTPAAGQFTFDLSTDPALQQVNALTGLSDQQAQAEAIKERQQLLLQYGDPQLAATVLGQNDPMVQAAAQNPESSLAMLGRQNTQNVKGFETQLDPSLTFSGYKIGQEQQLGQQYQDALAKAAGGAQQGLDQITGNLNSALQQNELQRELALLSLLMSGGFGGAGGSGDSGGGDGSTGAGTGTTPGGPNELGLYVNPTVDGLDLNTYRPRPGRPVYG